MRKYIYLIFLMFFVSVSAAMAAPVQWSVNGHYYERIDTADTWDNANTTANAMSYLGLQGHLVTITSAAENAFLTDDPALGGGTQNLLHFHWTGGYQPAGSNEPNDGWSWVTGELFSYNNWEPGEPNNSGDENRVIFDHGFGTDGKRWNDLNNMASAGYVVEYEASSVPEPTTLLLLGLGLLGLVPMRKKVL